MIDKVRVIDRIWSLDDDDVKTIRDEIVEFDVKPLDMKMKRKAHPRTKMDYVCGVFANVMNALEASDFEVKIEINRNEAGGILSVFQSFESELRDFEIRRSTDFDGNGIYVRELKNMNSNVYRVDFKDLDGLDQIRFNNMVYFVDQVLPIDKFI